MKKTKPTKTLHHHCNNCPATCCTNLAMAIGRPSNKKEVEDLKWQLHFDTVKVFIRHHRWYQWVEGRCMYLSKDNRCTNYDERPDICRQHNPPDCEFFGEFYDIMMSTPKELDSYLSKKPRKLRKPRKPTKNS